MPDKAAKREERGYFWGVAFGLLFSVLCFWKKCVWCHESLLNSKEIKPVNPKGNQPWIVIGRTDAEVPILWPHEANSRLIGKDPDAGKDWEQEEKGATEDEMFGWHHWLDGCEFEQTLGDGEGQGSLACCSLWGCRVRHNLAAEQQQHNWFWAFWLRSSVMWGFPWWLSGKESTC